MVLKRSIHLHNKKLQHRGTEQFLKTDGVLRSACSVRKRSECRLKQGCNCLIISKGLYPRRGVMGLTRVLDFSFEGIQKQMPQCKGQTYP
jgi:hypothetical protein